MPNIKRIDPQESSQSMPLIRSKSTVAANAADTGVQLQSSSAGRVRSFLIVANCHGSDLSYKINGVIAMLENDVCACAWKISYDQSKQEVPRVGISGNPRSDRPRRGGREANFLAARNETYGQ